MKTRKSWVHLAILLILPGLAFGNQKAEVNIDLKSAGQTIDRHIYGQFLEHFGRIIQGGLWAELLQNRKFYPVDPDRTQIAQPWKAEADRSNISYVIDRFESLDGVSSQRVSLFGDSTAWRGVSQSGFNVVAGKEYTAYAWIKTDSPHGRVAFRLESRDGKDPVQAEASAKSEGGQKDGWQKYQARLTPSHNLAPAVLRILFNTGGSNWIGAASLMPSDNIDGMRADVLALVKKMSPPIVRWPGGGYPDVYDWRNAIGPRDRRPPQAILPFGQPFGYDNGIDPNDFGTDEFLRFCEVVGADPYITANFGSGTPQMAANWVEYTNGLVSSTWGARRAENGHAQPYKIRNWSIGNEVWGDPFESGHTNAAGYAYFMAPIAKAMRAVDPQIQVTAVGDLGNLTGPDASWNESVISKTRSDVDLLSIHHYYPAGSHPTSFQGKPLDFYYAVVADPWIFEGKLRNELNKIDEITGPARKMKVALDEWSEWDWDYSFPADTPERSAMNRFIDLINQTGLEFNQTERDGIFNGRMLHMMMRLSDRVPIAVRTHMINSLGAIRTDSTSSFLTAPGVVMELYRNHSGENLVPLTQASATFDVPENGWQSVPYLDAVATTTGNKLFLHLINLHATESMDVHIKVAGVGLGNAGTLWQIAPQDFMARNDFGITDVALSQRRIEALGSDMVQTLPPHSITTIEADIQ